jgi:hypothetical protein
MNVFPPSPSGGQANAGPTLDPRLQPTPDYGTLGPGSDISRVGSPSNGNAPRKVSPDFLRLLAFVIGVVGALVAVGISRVQPAPSGFQNHVSSDQRRSATVKDLGQLDRMKPQKQAETLLELAVGQTQGANDQISSRVDRWPGKVRWNPQIASLTSAALNSNDMRVRESGIEVELAAYGLAKNSGSFQYLVKKAESPDHRQKIWALWALGLMGNRGVEPERVVGILTSHLKDPDAESRQWAVEGLALTAMDQTIDPLLKTMHDDPAPIVRERAACGLAEAGMFTPQQRMSAVPQLLNYTDDPALDAQTHGWAFQALHDITHQQLPNDSAAWRNWYEQLVASGQ